jgi:hypothetical protein
MNIGSCVVEWKHGSFHYKRLAAVTFELGSVSVFDNSGILLVFSFLM